MLKKCVNGTIPDEIPRSKYNENKNQCRQSCEASEDKFKGNVCFIVRTKTLNKFFKNHLALTTSCYFMFCS